MNKQITTLGEGGSLVLNSVENQFGGIIATRTLFIVDGIFMLEELNCNSSNSLGLGTCNCVSHPTYTTRLLTSSEVEAMGFEVEGITTPQMAFDDFGHLMGEIEAFCQASFEMGLNPLPHLRKINKGEYPISFVHGERQVFLTSGEPFWLVRLYEEGVSFELMEGYYVPSSDDEEEIEPLY
jgi:hypothetical protein